MCNQRVPTVIATMTRISEFDKCRIKNKRDWHLPILTNSWNLHTYAINWWWWRWWGWGRWWWWGRWWFILMRWVFYLTRTKMWFSKIDNDKLNADHNDIQKTDNNDDTCILIYEILIYIYTTNVHTNILIIFSLYFNAN